jgi:glycyl-tRNA synthetase beta chain
MNENTRHDLLVEIGTEELPSAAQIPLAEALAESLAAALADRALTPRATETFSTPRRLAVLARAVPAAEPERMNERRGPSLAAAFDAEGNPTRAAKGFARSAGVEIGALETLRTDKGEWLVHRQHEAGRPSIEVLSDILPDVLRSLPLKRRMRWGAGEAAFLRPVRWLVVRYGDTVVPIEAFGLIASGGSRGHRFHHPGAVAIPAPAHYAGALRNARVIADPGARRAEAIRQIEDQARALEATPTCPPILYDEISGMVEWPVAIVAKFDAKYLDLPEPVLITTLAHHQRFIPLRGANGTLKTRFIAVMNLESREPATLRAGLERVVRPRLEDAAFYYERDRARPLADYAPALEDLAFGERLGSMADKSARLEKLTAGIAGAIGADRKAAARAGRLAKCDLATGMVFEFPELQGVMGAIYAAADGEAEAVSHAIAEQYRPGGSEDALPETPVGAALALADRLDSLVGGFAGGREPTGAKDPFGLRRAAFGLLRIAAERAPNLDLTPWLDAAAALYPDSLAADTAIAALDEFLRERLRSMLLEAGHAPDVTQAVLAVAPLKPAEVLARAAAVSAFRARPEAEALASANKRIANILRQAGEVPRAGDGADAPPQEAALCQALRDAAPKLASALAARDFNSALAILAGLREPVDEFFDKVLVMDSDPAIRAQRLRLLSELRAAFLKVADIGELQGTGEK